MTISNKIKALMQLTQKSDEGLAAYLGVKRQSLRNKYVRNSFSADDLIMIADYCGVELRFIIDDKQSILLELEDVKDTENEIMKSYD